MNRLKTALFVAAFGVTALAIEPAFAAERAVWINDLGERVEIYRDHRGVRIRADGGQIHDYGSDNYNWYSDFRLDRAGARLIEGEPRVREPREPRAGGGGGGASGGDGGPRERPNPRDFRDP